jgi:hypothetical protein
VEDRSRGILNLVVRQIKPKYGQLARRLCFSGEAAYIRVRCETRAVVVATVQTARTLSISHHPFVSNPSSAKLGVYSSSLAPSKLSQIQHSSHRRQRPQNRATCPPQQLHVPSFFIQISPAQPAQALFIAGFTLTVALRPLQSRSPGGSPRPLLSSFLAVRAPCFPIRPGVLDQTASSHELSPNDQETCHASL